MKAWPCQTAGGSLRFVTVPSEVLCMGSSWPGWEPMMTFGRGVRGSIEFISFVITGRAGRLVIRGIREWSFFQMDPSFAQRIQSILTTRG